MTPHYDRNPQSDVTGKEILDKDVEAMLIKSAIKVVKTSNEEEIMLGYFLLKYTKQFIGKQTFRKITPSDIRKWIQSEYFFLSIDLINAYFTIGLHKAGRQFCRFQRPKKT